MALDQAVKHPIEGHCRRVCALAGEIASCLPLPVEDKRILEEAAWLHHTGRELLEGRVLERLLADLKLATLPASGPAGEAQAVVEALHRRPAQAADEKVSVLAEVLEIANFFEERLQYLPYERVTVEQILDELGVLAQEGYLRSGTLAALASLPRVRKEHLRERVYRLPVFPSVALKALEMAGEDASFAQLERLVSTDQVLAGRVLEAANSSLYSPVTRIATIRQAISYIGLEECQRVLMAAVFQPLFASANLHGLWKHSLEVSQSAERLAVLSRRASAEQAFLAGLVHDVGRLALQKSSGEDVIAYTRLLEKGCEPVFAELVLCGFDHGEGGAEILRLWSFPEHLVEAVAHHHQPEHSDSVLASVLHLAEFWSESEEDLPSAFRVRAALERTGLTFDLLRQRSTVRRGWVESMARAAG